MDQNQFEVLKQTYSNMSDQDLAYLAVTKEGQLTEEGNLALSEAIRSRDSLKLEAEMRAVRADLTQQFLASAEKQKRHEKAQFQARTAMRIMALIFVAGGLLVAALVDPTKGIFIGVAGFGLFVIYEVRRLLGKFLTALFRND